MFHSKESCSGLILGHNSTLMFSNTLYNIYNTQNLHLIQTKYEEGVASLTTLT